MCLRGGWFQWGEKKQVRNKSVLLRTGMVQRVRVGYSWKRNPECTTRENTLTDHVEPGLAVPAGSTTGMMCWHLPERQGWRTFQGGDFDLWSPPCPSCSSKDISDWHSLHLPLASESVTPFNSEFQVLEAALGFREREEHRMVCIEGIF